MTGEPKVKKEAYIKKSLIVPVAIPSFSPIQAHTPNICSSTRACSLFISVLIIRRLKRPLLTTKLRLFR